MSDAGPSNKGAKPSGNASKNPWSLRDVDGSITQLSEQKLYKRLIAAGDDIEKMSVRRSDSGWHPAKAVLQKYERLQAEGIYLRVDGHVDGPFTAMKSMELLRESDSVNQMQAKVGLHSDWFPAKRLLRRLEKLTAEKEGTEQANPPGDDKSGSSDSLGESDIIDARLIIDDLEDEEVIDVDVDLDDSDTETERKPDNDHDEDELVSVQIIEDASASNSDNLVKVELIEDDDQVKVEIIEDQPANKPVVAPVVAPVATPANKTAQPMAPAAKTPDTKKVKPTPADTKSEAAQPTTTADDAAKLPVAKPVKVEATPATPVAKPVTATPVAKPVTVTPVTKPVSETPVAKTTPVATPVVVQPVVAAPVAPQPAPAVPVVTPKPKRPDRYTSTTRRPEPKTRQAKIIAGIGAAGLFLLICIGGGVMWLVASLNKNAPIEDSNASLTSAASDQDSIAEVALEPPVLREGTIYRPTIRTGIGEAKGGILFSARLGRSNQLLLIGAASLLGPNNGLERQLRGAEVLIHFKELTVQDCLSKKSEKANGSPLRIRSTAEYPEFSQSGDAFAFATEGHMGLDPLSVGRQDAKVGDRIWLLAPVAGRETMTHPGEIIGRQDDWLLYQLDNVNLSTSSVVGAPIITDDREVLGIHVAVDGSTNVASPINMLVPAIE